VQTNPVTPTSSGVSSAMTRVLPAQTEFVGFWESWNDWNAGVAFNQLSDVPKTVTTVDLAFSDFGYTPCNASPSVQAPAWNKVTCLQNSQPLAPGAEVIHKHHGKILLSFGGSVMQEFAVNDPAAFVASLHAYLKTNPGIFDGFDFDDEVIPSQGSQPLIAAILAVRKAFPKATITFDAFLDGALPAGQGHQGEDLAILREAGAAIDWVNVMEYDFGGYYPPSDTGCSLTEGSSNDCRIVTLESFAKAKLADGAPFPKSKIVMGLMIGADDFCQYLSPAQTAGYARWVKQHAYRGIMIWDLDRDNPATGPTAGDGPCSGTNPNYPKGTYVKTIAAALQT
jgi:GH18 family chitinase